MPTLPILYEDNHLLVVNKPAGVATMGAPAGAPTVHLLAADYLKRKYHKPGNVYVGVVSRLDTVTSGTLVLARTSKAAARLQAQFAGGDHSELAKVYLAVLEGHPPEPQGTFQDYVAKDDRARRMRVVNEGHAGAKSAKLDYFTLSRGGGQSWIAVRLRSGRKHQIRLQFAERQCPVLGDRKYGGNARFPAGIGLHSWRLRVRHPTKKDLRWYASRLPKSWRMSKLNTESPEQHWPAIADAFQLIGE